MDVVCGVPLGTQPVGAPPGPGGHGHDLQDMHMRILNLILPSCSMEPMYFMFASFQTYEGINC